MQITFDWPKNRQIGVAPDVTLFVYKVFTKASETDDETLIDSFLKAYDDGVSIKWEVP